MGLATAYFEDGRVLTTDDIYKAFDAVSGRESKVRFVRLIGEFVMDRQLFCSSRLIAVDARAAKIRGYWSDTSSRTMFFFRNQDVDIEVFWEGGEIAPDRIPNGVKDNALEAIRVESIHCNVLAVINNLTMKNLAGGLCFQQVGGGGSGLAVVANCRILNGYGDRTVTGGSERGHSQGMFTMGNFKVIDIGCLYHCLGWVPDNQKMYPKTIFNQDNYFVGYALRSILNSHSAASHTGIVCATGDSFLAGNHYGGNGLDEAHGHKDHPYKARVRSYGGDHSEGMPVFDIPGQHRQGCYSVDAAASSVIVGPTYNIMDPSLPVTDDWAFVGISRRGVADVFELHNVTVSGRNLGLSTTLPLDNKYLFNNVDTSGCVTPLRCGWAETGPDSPIGGTWTNCNVPGYTTDAIGPGTIQ
jgi:hypothetical protein